MSGSFLNPKQTFACKFKKEGAQGGDATFHTRVRCGFDENDLGKCLSARSPISLECCDAICKNYRSKNESYKANKR